jgi:hypothetical protein
MNTGNFTIDELADSQNCFETYFILTMAVLGFAHLLHDARQGKEAALKAKEALQAVGTDADYLMAKCRVGLMRIEATEEYRSVVGKIEDEAVQ